jgi:hypothetical protein
MLEKLEVNKNQLASLTSSVGALQSLLKLSLKANKLTTLPGSIGNLVNLNELCVGSNLLKSLPPEMGKLVNLEILLCYGNQLEMLPDEVGDLANLKYLALQSNLLSGETCWSSCGGRGEEGVVVVEYLYDCGGVCNWVVEEFHVSILRRTQNFNFLFSTPFSFTTVDGEIVTVGRLTARLQ